MQVGSVVHTNIQQGIIWSVGENTGGRMVEWPARSPDLSPLDFLFPKSNLYTNSPGNILGLEDLIRQQMQNKTPAILQNLISEYNIMF